MKYVSNVKPHHYYGYDRGGYIHFHIKKTITVMVK